MSMRIMSIVLLGALLCVPRAAASQAAGPGPAPTLASQVEIRRTTFGVPHIKAQNLRAGAYALAYVQLEYHGARVAMGLLRARGEMARWFGHDSIEGDFAARRDYETAVARYPDLSAETREVYEGFAIGVNRYGAVRARRVEEGGVAGWRHRRHHDPALSTGHRALSTVAAAKQTRWRAGPL